MHEYFIYWDVDNICDTKSILQNLQVVQVPTPLPVLRAPMELWAKPCPSELFNFNL